ncbi:MAG: septum formation protein Maf [Gemmatimonadetes bacterium]|nr:septum formation protein Maf [Gemmatimonadota bacterium]NNM05948.1 septum formation protein Maf [Gemmatimonadota bacterium]
MNRPPTGPRLILASASPRRAELLSRLGLTFEVIPAHIPEEWLGDESPEDHAERLSVAKVMKVSVANPGSLVVGGDTVVIRDDHILGKPRDAGEALSVLMSLAGRRHRVVSGLALVFPGGELRSGHLGTEVTFRAFEEDLARAYVETGEPMDKAGAYGIQGLGGALVTEIRGDYHNVMGLPLPLFLDLLLEGGYRYDFGGLTSLGL